MILKFVHSKISNVQKINVPEFVRSSLLTIEAGILQYLVTNLTICYDGLFSNAPEIEIDNFNVKLCGKFVYPMIR